MKLKQVLHQVKVSISWSQKTPHKNIKKIAFKLYQNRQITEEKGDAEQDWVKAEQIANNPLRLILFKFNQPLIKTEKKFLEPFLGYLNRLAVIEILNLTSNITILIAVIVFVASEKDRRDSEIYQAWQVITAAYGQKGSGGRIQALEFLNSRPRRNPWFWLTWDRESLRGLEAPNAYLRGIQLSNADLGDANLKGAILQGANLQEAFLRDANLQEAYLRDANLQEANLGDANLKGAILGHTNLQEAFLMDANLQEAFLVNANLKGAILQGAILQEANLGLGFSVFVNPGKYSRIVDVKGTILQEANLQEANLQGAILQGAILQEANLQGAILQEANLQGAILQGAILQGAILKNAIYTDKSTLKVTCERLYLKYPCPTIFPEKFNPKTAGMKLIKELKDIP
ncbi:MAG: pentapeptide repeat-containing protein [Moorea sp. SIO4A1]|nr:pentapeptide repeat-containing protein [Moorena sp. SIO4A1]NEQ61462.1 pentapeptide repeat-containing protein [Moorena sp. SIO4A1]